MNKKNLRYKSSSEIRNLKIFIGLYHPEGYEKTTEPMETYSRFDMTLELVHNEKNLSLYYHNETLDEMFERVNKAEKGIEALLGLDLWAGENYDWEHDRRLLRGLLALEDKLMKKLKMDAPPLILDGDTGAS